MNLMPFVVLWLALAVTVIALLVWRRSVARNEDDALHVLDGAAAQHSVAQVQVAQKLELIDKWGKIITVVAVVYGIALGGAYLYQSWVQNSRIGV